MPISPKPAHLSPIYSAQFQDLSVVDAYRFRPPYPPAVFSRLEWLMGDRPAAVLDIGCGRGDLARHLIDVADRVDAVDFSAAMIETGKRLPGGESSRLHWICAPAEDAPLRPPYALVTAGESLHWMDWGRLLPRLHEVLAPGAALAIVQRHTPDLPWQPKLQPLIEHFSTNRDFVPYDVIDELTSRGLFAEQGRERTSPTTVRQTIADYVESIHSRNGFSRGRMSAGEAAQFDAAVTHLVQPFVQDGVLTLPVTGEIIWGQPQEVPQQDALT